MKPIGSWLNRTDQAITHHLDGTLAGFEPTRLAWQILNVVKNGGSDSDLQANTDETTLRATLDDLIAHDRATRDVHPAPEGLTRLADVAERVGTFRELSMAGSPWTTTAPRSASSNI